MPARRRIRSQTGEVTVEGGGEVVIGEAALEWGPRFGKTEDETFTSEAASDLSAVDLTGQVDGSTTVTMDQVDLTGNVAITSAIDLYSVDLDGQVDPTAAFTMDSVDLTGNLATTAAVDLAQVDLTGNVATTGIVSGTAEGAPFWQDKETLVEFGAVTARTVNKPSGTIEGDLLVAHLCSADLTARPDFTAGGPSGWTQVTRFAPTATILSASEVWWKIATASEPISYTWTSAATHTVVIGTIHQIRGVDQTTPIDVFGTRFSPSTDLDTTPNQPNITTTVDNCLVLSFLLHDHNTSSGSAVHGPAANQIERDDNNAPQLTRNISNHMQERVYATAGSTDGVGHGCQQAAGADAAMIRVAIAPGPLDLV